MASAVRPGVLGLGLIGSRVAARLNAAGFAPAVWNRTPRDFPALPALADSPASVARAAEVLQIFVADDDALEETVAAILPELSSRHVVVSHATVSPDTVMALASRVTGTGAGFLDAPFTGSRDAAAAGQITYYIGGAEADLARARPVLDCTAKAVIPLGPVGTASAVKLATNVMAAAAAVSLAEAVNLLRARGLDPALLTTALETNAARSGVTDLKLPCMLGDDFAPRFSVRNMRKDLRLARDSSHPGRRALIESMLGLYDSACDTGLGDEDFSSVVKVRS